MKHQSIVSLVLSLTPVEKQHFKKSNDPASDFVLLFDFINKNKSYDPQKFNVFLVKKKQKAKSTVGEISSGYLSVIKKYLREKIMESLRSVYVPRRTPYQMFIRSLNADILLEKGLYQLAKEEIQFAKNKSLNNSFPIEKLMLYRRESIIQFYEDYSGSTFEEINELYENRVETAEQLLLEIKYARILTILSYQYFKGVKDSKLLQSFIEEDYMQDPSLAKEFGTKYLYYWVHAQFAEFQNQPEEAIRYFEKTIQNWVDHPDYIKAHPRMYLGTCYTYLKYILQQKKPMQMVLKEEELVSLVSKISKIQLEKDTASKYEQLFQLAQLLSFHKNRMYDEIIKIAPIVLKSLKSIDITTDFVKILIRYFIAVAHFQRNHFRKTLDFLHHMIFTKELQLKANPEYYNHVLKLYILTQYELKNSRFLKSELKRIKQDIMGRGSYGVFEEYFFQMISQLNSPRFSQQKQKVLERFYNRMSKAITENINEEKVEYQIVLNWVSKKMEDADV